MKRSWTTLLAGVLLVALGTPHRAGAQPAPYEINVILSITGSGAFLGAKETDSLRAVEDLTNRTGGIQGRPLKFVIADDASNPQVAVQLVNGLIAKKVAMILGPSLTTSCFAIEPLVSESGPLTYCFSPGTTPKPRSYYFVNAPHIDDLFVAVLRYFRERHLTRLGLAFSIDTVGRDFEKRYEKTVAMPEFHDVTVAAKEYFNPTDLNFAAQVSRLKAAKPEAIIVTTVGSPFGTVLRSLRDGGLENVPIYTEGANMTYTQMTQYADFLPKELDFSGRRGIVPEPLGTGPVKRAQDRYFDELKRLSIRPESVTALPWDNANLIVDGLRKIGPDATATQLRDFLLAQRDWTGIEGTYDFTNGDQRGIGTTASAVFRWDATKSDFVVVYPHR